MPKTAVIHVPHEQCETSLAEMLSSVGYRVYGIGRDVSHKLNEHMKPVVASRLPMKAELKQFYNCDLFATVKHYNIPSILERYPGLKGKLLWFDINGGVPGEEITREPRKGYPLEVPIPYVSANKRYLDESGYNVSGPRYVCYIPLPNRLEFSRAAHKRTATEPPVCLVHNPSNWGYGWLVQPLIEQHQVRFFGSHGAPNGLLKPSDISRILTTALCMVHAKGRDCPGCALYESLLTGCPVIITDLFLRRTLYTDLYVHNETCLVVNDENTWPIPERCEHLMKQISVCIERLRDPEENKRIGGNGRRKISGLMWQSTKQEDVESFKAFMNRCFP